MSSSSWSRTSHNNPVLLHTSAGRVNEVFVNSQTQLFSSRIIVFCQFHGAGFLPLSPMGKVVLLRLRLHTFVDVRHRKGRDKTGQPGSLNEEHIKTHN